MLKQSMTTLMEKLLVTQRLYEWCKNIHPYLIAITLLLFAYGLLGALYLAPADYQQGDGFRIIYVHVPSAFWSMLVYSIMTVSAIVALVWRIKVADMVVFVSAPIGAWFTALTLITGSLWGKPMWGTWWIWDARLTSEFILLFIYLGIIGLQHLHVDWQKSARTANIFTIVGAVNLPIIHYSVYWWNTLHQGATISRLSKPLIAPSMLYPLLAMIAAFGFYYLWYLAVKLRAVLLQRERQMKWVSR